MTELYEFEFFSQIERCLDQPNWSALRVVHDASPAGRGGKLFATTDSRPTRQPDVNVEKTGQESAGDEGRGKGEAAQQWPAKQPDERGTFQEET